MQNQRRSIALFTMKAKFMFVRNLKFSLMEIKKQKLINPNPA